MKICVIDIGTNSIHAIFAEIRSTGLFSLIGREKEMVRLGDGAMVSGHLSEAAILRALAVLKRFVHLAKHRGMTRIIAIATSAVRESENGGDFIDRVRRETDLKVQVITGNEEGRLIYKAVRNTVDFGKDRALVVDIGGGSTEFIAADGENPLWIESLRLGANRLSQLFPLTDPPKKSEIKALEDYVEAMLLPVLKRLAENPCALIVGTSGTITALMRAAQAADGDGSAAPPSRISRDFLDSAYGSLARSRLAERQKLKGVDKARADMIVHGAAIINTLMRVGRIPELLICDKALREGVLFDFIEKNRRTLRLEEEIPDIRRRGIMTLCNRYEPLKAHAEQTAKLALKLFDALQGMQGLGAADRELLEYAALVHDVGYLVNFQKHHKHTFYLIMNTELDGFTAEEILVLAWTARLHRRGSGRKDEEFGALALALQKRILKLSAILRIADGLDHSHFALVTDLRVKDDGETLRIRLETRGDAQWEVHEAIERKDTFEKVFGRKVEFRIKTLAEG